MQIDWITVAAQIVNFLILVWLLHRYLYGPIVRAMNGREERIAARLRDAAQSKAEAEREAERFRSERENLEKEKSSILARATQEAESTRHSLEDAVRRESEQMRKDWLKQVDDEKAAFLHDMRRRSADHVMALARRTLSELADTQLEEQVATAFARQIEHLEPHLHDRLAKASRQAGGVIVVQSSFILNAEAQRRLAHAVHKGIIAEAEIRYEQADGMICGIELKAGSQTLTWAFSNFLDELEQRLSKDLSEIHIPHEAPSAS